jgi:hypothetical protein
MTHMTTPTTPAALQQQMLDLIEELRTAPSYRRQQRCLAQIEVLRYQLHSHPDLLEKLAALLAVTGQALQDPVYSAVMRLAAVPIGLWGLHELAMAIHSNSPRRSTGCCTAALPPTR